MPDNPKNKIIQPVIKYYINNCSVLTKALHWIQLTTDYIAKFKIDTKYYKQGNKLLDFIDA